MSYTLTFSGEEIEALLQYLSNKTFSDSSVEFEDDLLQSASLLESGDTLAEAFKKLNAWREDYFSRHGGVLHANAGIYSLGGGTIRFPNIEIGTGVAPGIAVERTDMKAQTMPTTPTSQQYPSLTLFKRELEKRVKIDRGSSQADAALVGSDGIGVWLGARYNGGTPYIEFAGSELDEAVELRNLSRPSFPTSAATKGYVDEVLSNAVLSVNGKTGTVTLYPSDIRYQSVYGDEQFFDVGYALDAYGNDLQKLLNDAVFERVNGRYKAKDDIDMDEHYIRNAFFDVLSIDGDGYIHAVPTDDDSITNKKYVDEAIAAAIGNVDTLLGSGVIE